MASPQKLWTRIADEVEQVEEATAVAFKPAMVLRLRF